MEKCANEVVCREGDNANHAWLLLDGEVKLIRHTTTGHVLLVDILLAGELFGAVFYTEHPVQPATAMAVKPTRLLTFPISVFTTEQATNPALQSALLEDTCLKLCQSIALRGLGLEEVPVRIASILCRLSEKFGRIIPETRSTLAELAGTTTETAIRVTRDLAEDGVLRLGRGRIEVLDLTRLQSQSALTAPHQHRATINPKS